MNGLKYIKILVEDIHSTIVATIGADGHPQTRVIDMMLYDDNGVYFLTAKGEYFDISNPSKIVREGIVIGAVVEVRPGYYVGKECIGCKLCYSVCPQKCIDVSKKPVEIDQNHCLHCGRCEEICPKQTIKKVG